MIERKISIKRLFKLLLSGLLYYSGIIRLYQRRQEGILILAYHRVADLPFDIMDMAISPAHFEKHIRFLSQNYTLIPLKRAVEVLAEPKKIPTNIAVITFDDGYKDFKDNALPVIQKYQVPVSVFLSPGVMVEGRWFWWDRVIEAVINSKKENLDLEKFQLGHYDLRSAEHRQKAALQIIDHLKRCGVTNREETLSFIWQELQNRHCDGRNYQLLSWDEIESLQGNLITFETQGWSHTVLTNLPREEVKYEITEAKKQLDARLQKKITCFAYPNGGKEDFDELAIQELRNTGYDSACTLVPGFNRQDEQDGSFSLFTLRRLTITWDMSWGIAGKFSQALFASELSGLLSRLLRRSAK